MGFFDRRKKRKENILTPEQREAEKRAQWDNIICPFCFERFSHNNVAFRSMVGFTEDTISEAELRQAQNAAEGKDDYQLRSMIENMKRYAIKPDPVYRQFWGRMVGDPDFTLDEYCEYPVINAGSDEVTNRQYDNDGFLVSICDASGKSTDRRICPYCHNKLSRFYGKTRVKFMSTIGVTSSGKTVYLSQLLRNLENLIVKYNCAVLYSDEAYEFINSKPVENGLPLPVGTTIEFVPPMYFNLQTHYGDQITIVLYDIAGEVFTNSESVVKYGPFIKNSDGLIVLIDPGQFPVIKAMLKNVDIDNDSTSDGKAMPTLVLAAIHNAFMGGDTGKSNICTAVTISKSDMLLGLTDELGAPLIPYESNIRMPVSPSPNGGFNETEYSNVNADTWSVINKSYPALHNTVANNFANYGYFAVSALGCNVARHAETGLWTPEGIPSPMRIEEPLMWLLKNWHIIP